jgi:hypothetical protein
VVPSSRRCPARGTNSLEAKVFCDERAFSHAYQDVKEITFERHFVLSCVCRVRDSFLIASRSSMANKATVKDFRKSAMLSPSIYPWFSAYRAAVLEPDFTLVPERVRAALSFIHDRLNGPAQMDEPERQAIADARAGLKKLNEESVNEWDARTTDDLIGN